MRNIKKMITCYFERVINIQRWDPGIQIDVFISYGY